MYVVAGLTAHTNGSKSRWRGCTEGRNGAVSGAGEHDREDYRADVVPAVVGHPGVQLVHECRHPPEIWYVFAAKWRELCGATWKSRRRRRKVYYAWYTARGGLETLLSISSRTVALARLSFVRFGKAKYWRLSVLRALALFRSCAPHIGRGWDDVFLMKSCYFRGRRPMRQINDHQSR